MNAAIRIDLGEAAKRNIKQNELEQVEVPFGPLKIKLERGLLVGERVDARIPEEEMLRRQVCPVQRISSICGRSGQHDHSIWGGVATTGSKPAQRTWFWRLAIPSLSNSIPMKQKFNGAVLSKTLM